MKPKRSKLLALLALAVSLILPVPSLSAKGKAKGENPGYDAGKDGTQVAVEIFIGKDRELIKSYFVSHHGNLPPGLAKRGADLPPGLQKQLRRKGQLPPGLQKRLTPFPVELERSLCPLKDGLGRGFIEGRAVIYNRKTSVILDVFAVL